MKAVRHIDDYVQCRYEDAIYYNDDTFRSISFNGESSFYIGERESIDKLFEDVKDGWTVIYPSLEFIYSDIKAETGETSWGGAAFIGLKKLTQDSYNWIIHLSVLNNPQAIWIKGTNIHVITDLNYPNGIEFVIPIEAPERISTSGNTS